MYLRFLALFGFETLEALNYSTMFEKFTGEVLITDHIWKNIAIVKMEVVSTLNASRRYIA